MSPATQKLHAALKVRIDGNHPRQSDIELLISAGADVNAVDENGHSALHLCLLRLPHPAYRSMAHDILHALLAAGADLDKKLPDGRRCDTLAAQWDDDGIAARLLPLERRRRADSYLAKNIRAIKFWWPAPGQSPTGADKSDFLNSCQAGNMDHLHYMLHVHPASAHWAFDTGNTGLITAVLAGVKRYDVTAVLLAKGADVNRANDFGMTALMYACKLRDAADCIDMLVAAGADEKAVSQANLSAFDYARCSSADAAALPRLQNALITRAAKREKVAALKRQMHRDSAKFTLRK